MIWTSEQNPARDRAGALPRFVQPVATGTLAEPGAIGIDFAGSNATLMGSAESAGVIAKPNWNNATGTATPGTSTDAYVGAPVNAIQIVSTSLTPPVLLDPPATVPAIGAAQGVELRDGKVYLYGDASTA
jgi:hypothetical protein